jgi:hypothetical protein
VRLHLCQAPQGAGDAPQKSWANIKRGLIMLRNIFWKVGVLGDYRRCSGSSRWAAARGDIEGLIGSA